MVGLWTVESRIRGWVCLRKIVFGATQIDLDCCLSSPQPLKSIENRSKGLRDREAEKRLILVHRCADVIEVRLTLV